MERDSLEREAGAADGSPERLPSPEGISLGCRREFRKDLGARGLGTNKSKAIPSSRSLPLLGLMLRGKLKDDKEDAEEPTGQQ